MKTIYTAVYSFDELTEEAKEQARAWYRDGALDYEWWDSTYEDAARIGLKIESFDLDRNRHATGRFTLNGIDVAKLILAEHGPACETHKTATAFLSTVEALDKAGLSEYDTEEKLEALITEFERSLLEDYAVMLQNESEYLSSDEQVDESIRANEYTFTENGKRCG